MIIEYSNWRYLFVAVFCSGEVVIQEKLAQEKAAEPSTSGLAGSNPVTTGDAAAVAAAAIVAAATSSAASSAVAVAQPPVDAGSVSANLGAVDIPVPGLQAADRTEAESDAEMVNPQHLQVRKWDFGYPKNSSDLKYCSPALNSIYCSNEFISLQLIETNESVKSIKTINLNWLFFFCKTNCSVKFIN